MMKVNRVEFDDSGHFGHVIALKGEAKPNKRQKKSPRVFSSYTEKVYNWAELRLEYCGG